MEDQRNRGYLSLLRLNRAQAARIVVVGLVLAIGVNLVAVYVESRLGSAATLGVGIGATVVGTLLILGRVFRPQSRLRDFEGFFIYDERANELAEHDFEYGFGYALQGYLKAAFAEDASLKMIWDHNPISGAKDRAKGAGSDARKSLNLVGQAAEYFVLERLSTRVSDHFRSGDFDEDELETLSHTDIPDVLLQNRFLRTFAEPMEDRAAFSGEAEGGSDGWTTVMAHAPGGAFYSRFELVLPKGWRVKRAGNRDIEFDANRFTLTISTSSEGWGEVLPHAYLSDYLGLEEMDDEGIRIATLRVSVSIRISPRRAWLVGPNGWRYYRWIDEWIADLEPEIDQGAYLDRIDYAGAETTLKMLQTWRRKQAGLPASGRPPDAQGGEIASDGTPRELERRRPQPAYSVGDAVEHAAFGDGVVVGSDDWQTVSVKFERDGSTRDLYVPFAPLRPAERNGGDG